VSRSTCQWQCQQRPGAAARPKGAAGLRARARYRIHAWRTGDRPTDRILMRGWRCDAAAKAGGRAPCRCSTAGQRFGWRGVLVWLVRALDRPAGSGCARCGRKQSILQCVVRDSAQLCHRRASETAGRAEPPTPLGVRTGGHRDGDAVFQDASRYVFQFSYGVQFIPYTTVRVPLGQIRVRLVRENFLLATVVFSFVFVD
jgi:hypothetical protein